MHAETRQNLLRGPSDTEHIRCREIPYLLSKRLLSDTGDCIRLLEIGAQLCKNLVEADSYGYSKAHLCLHGFADLVCNLNGGAFL